ncbi:hypothetical protein Gbfr_024_012 [Gluconobacter frateurii M-2]|nr:hypothetical protein Gbfr_024_012 [Gluconobacter frateurii M-2]
MPQDGYGIEDVMGREDARVHLAALETFQGKMTEELTCPLWYAPVIGGLFAMLTYAMSLERPFMFALEGDALRLRLPSRPLRVGDWDILLTATDADERGRSHLGC